MGDAERLALIEAWPSGESIASISARIGVPRSVISKEIRRLSLPLRPGQLQAEKAVALRWSSYPVSFLTRVEPAPPPAITQPMPSPSFKTCQWPLSNSRPWYFCDAPIERGQIYCPGHHAMAYHKHPRQHQP